MTKKERPPKLVLFFCLPFSCLSIACWCSQNYLAPLAGSGSYETISPQNNCVAWGYQPQQMPSQLCKLDLTSGRVSIMKLSQLRAAMVAQVGHLYIRNQSGIEIFDSITGELRWRDSALDGFDYLVGERFLISATQGFIQVVDLKPVFNQAGNGQDIKLEPVVHSIDGLSARRLWGEADYILPVSNADRFLCLTSQPSGFTATVYDVSAQEIKAIRQWPCSEVPAILHANKVWTFAAKPDRLEVRSQDDFRLLNTLPIPDELKAELAKWSDVKHHKDLISFPGIQALAPVVFRLEDLSLVAGVDLPPIRYFSEQRVDARYHLLANELPGNHPRIAVYDAHSRQLAYDAQPPRGLVSARIVDGQLVLVTEAMGLTVELVDLATGQRSARYQPFRWYVLATPVLCLLALVWFVMWRRYSFAWLHPLANIAFVALLFLTPLVWRASTIHYWNILWRPAVGFSLAALFAISFAAAVLTALGTQRILLRLTGLCLWLSCVGLALRGLLAIDGQDRSQLVSVESMLVKMLLFTVGTTLVLSVCRRCGWTPTLTASARSSVPLPQAAAMPMRDMFALTAGIAGPVSVMTPCYDYLRQHVTHGWDEIGIIFVFASSGLLALARNQRLFQVVADIHIALACVVILAATLNLAWADCAWNLWYRQACGLSYLLLVMVSSFGLCSLIRTAGT